MTEEVKSYEIQIKKIFDMNIKKGSEIKKVYLDENEFQKKIYILKGMRIFKVDISKKKVEELEFTKGKSVVYITSSQNNENILFILNNGSVFILEKFGIKQIRNFPIKTLIGKTNESFSSKNFKMFASKNIDKLIIISNNYLSVWHFCSQSFNSSTKLNEMNGKFYQISIKSDRELGDNRIEGITGIFGNNYFYGSFGKIFLFSISDYKNKVYPSRDTLKLTLVTYLIKFDEISNEKLTPEETNISPQEVRNIEKKMIYSYIEYPFDFLKESCEKKKLILKSNLNTTCLAIAINSNLSLNSCLMLYMTETAKTSFHKIDDLIRKFESTKFEEGKFKIWIEDIEWICNDLYLIILFSQGYFCIVNTNFNLIYISNAMNSNAVENLICPLNYLNTKINSKEKLSIIASKRRNVD